MKTMWICIVIMCAVNLSTPIMATAVSYPISDEHRLISEKGAVKAGSTIYLFHSGTADVKKAIEENDILDVHGARDGKVKEVGKIRIISYVGDYYLKGEVLEGEVRHDDIATKGGASCLVILEGEVIK